MGLALLMAATGAAHASADEGNWFGFATDTGTEANTQASCTEAATFSLFRARVLSGNSGTATFRFRDAGADGNQTFQISGTGTNEDATNSDSLTAGDLFNYSYTDTGSNAGMRWVGGNVSFSSGHGNFHGAGSFAAVVFEVASATQFIGLAGNVLADGSATENNIEWTNRGYTSFEALQVRVTANARTNNSDFRNRIDGGDGSLLCQFTAGATGLISDTSPADTITDGQTINASITLDTGVQELSVTLVMGTLKSSTSKSETWSSNAAGAPRAASATASYCTVGGVVPNPLLTDETMERIKIGFAAVVSNLRCYLSANTYTVNGTLKLMQNGSAVITTTIGAGGGAAWYENTSDTITIDADDELSFEFDEGTSGSITIRSVGITFAPVAAAGGTLLPKLLQHGLFVGSYA